MLTLPPSTHLLEQKHFHLNNNTHDRKGPILKSELETHFFNLRALVHFLVCECKQKPTLNVTSVSSFPYHGKHLPWRNVRKSTWTSHCDRPHGIRGKSKTAVVTKQFITLPSICNCLNVSQMSPSFVYCVPTQTVLCSEPLGQWLGVGQYQARLHSAHMNADGCWVSSAVGKQVQTGLLSQESNVSVSRHVTDVMIAEVSRVPGFSS